MRGLESAGAGGGLGLDEFGRAFGEGADGGERSKAVMGGGRAGEGVAAGFGAVGRRLRGRRGFEHWHRWGGGVFGGIVGEGGLALFEAAVEEDAEGDPAEVGDGGAACNGRRSGV